MGGIDFVAAQKASYAKNCFRFKNRDLLRGSKRYQTIGEELLRFTDRNEWKMVLGMIYEELVSGIVPREIDSYKQLLSAIYQVQTKYRDEARPRVGLLGVANLP